MNNKLYYGDCLTIMQNMNQASVDLIYLDPPFNSARDYNAIYKDETGRPLPDQIEAFRDTWQLDKERERALRNMPLLMHESGIDDNVVEFWKLWMNALKKTQPALLAYLSYMTERLLPMRSILKPSGSIYLHCDPTASHYIKVMMDAIFGHKNFRNEIIWQRNDGRAKGSQHKSKKFGSNTDTILFYTKTNNYTFNSTMNVPHDEEWIEEKFPEIHNGRRYKKGIPIFRSPSMGERPNLCFEWRGFTNPHPCGWRMKKDRLEEEYQKGNIVITGNKIERRKYLDDYKGIPLDNNWTDIPRVTKGLGYATEKPVPLLERIINASSNKGDVVFDPFCGCASTIEAAQILGRRWIGIDIAIHAIKRVSKTRLQDHLGLIDGQDYIIEGIPKKILKAHGIYGYATNTISKSGRSRKWMALLRQNAPPMAELTVGYILRLPILIETCLAWFSKSRVVKM